jgi:hypothetical protein
MESSEDEFHSRKVVCRGQWSQTSTRALVLRSYDATRLEYSGSTGLIYRNHSVFTSGSGRI